MSLHFARYSGDFKNEMPILEITSFISGRKKYLAYYIEDGKQKEVYLSRNQFQILPTLQDIETKEKLKNWIEALSNNLVNKIAPPYRKLRIPKKY